MILFFVIKCSPIDEAGSGKLKMLGLGTWEAMEETNSMTETKHEENIVLDRPFSGIGFLCFVIIFCI